MTTQDKRTYLVLDTTTGYGRLVKTVSQRRALDYVVGGRFTVRTATQDDIIIAMQSGVPVEEITDTGIVNSQPIPARRATDPKPPGVIVTGVGPAVAVNPYLAAKNGEETAAPWELDGQAANAAAAP